MSSVHNESSVKESVVAADSAGEVGDSVRLAARAEEPRGHARAVSGGVLLKSAILVEADDVILDCLVDIRVLYSAGHGDGLTDLVGRTVRRGDGSNGA